MYCNVLHWYAQPVSKLSQGELATTSLEFEYLHGKSQCEMLIGGDDISNDVITLGGCFHMFFKVCYIPTRFRFMLIGRSLTAQSTESHRGIRGGNWKKDLRLGHSQVPKTNTKYKIFLVNIISPACVRINFIFLLSLFLHRGVEQLGNGPRWAQLRARQVA